MHDRYGVGSQPLEKLSRCILIDVMLVQELDGID